MANRIYDVIVLGGGPAGYTAAMYATRAGLDTLVIEKFFAGGQMTQTRTIDNYPGFCEGIDGFTLGENMKVGAERFGAVTKQSEVISADLLSEPKKVFTDNDTLLTRSVIVAMGAEHRHLGIEGEEQLIGRGVCYCAACDGMLYRGKTVAVVGGGNSAAADALLLSKVCKKVYLIHRRDTLRAEKVYHEPLMKAENVEFIWNSEITSLQSGMKITGIEYKNKLTGESSQLEIDGLFVSIGRDPVSSIFSDQLDLDEKGYIIADETTRTNIEGVYAVGDIRTKPFRQIVTAAADGAVAAHSADEYISNKKL
jgi:thioredoxin reductase (NADPH)